MTIHYKNAQWSDKKVIIGESELTPDQAPRLLIGFHGAGSTPENMLIHGNKLKLSNTLFAYPEGPVDAGEGLWSWWQDGPRQSVTVKRFLDHAADLLEEASTFAKEQSGYNPHLCLWGFSQGGAAALVYSLLGSHTLHKVASVCGFLPELPDELPRQIHNTSILGIYGLNDDVVPSFLAEYALDEMSEQGHCLTKKETSQGHEVHAENIADIIRFLETDETLPSPELS